MSDTKVKVADEKDLEIWDKIVDLSETGTIFHKLEWLHAAAKHTKSELYPPLKKNMLLKFGARTRLHSKKENSGGAKIGKVLNGLGKNLVVKKEKMQNREKIPRQTAQPRNQQNQHRRRNRLDRRKHLPLRAGLLIQSLSSK